MAHVEELEGEVVRTSNGLFQKSVRSSMKGKTEMRSRFILDLDSAPGPGPVAVVPKQRNGLNIKY